MYEHNKSSHSALHLYLRDKPTVSSFEGSRVTLRPLDLERDLEPLYSVSNGAAITIGNRTYPEYDSLDLIWKYTPIGPFPNISEFSEYLSGQLAMKTQLKFCVFDTCSDMQIWVTILRYLEIQHLTAELGVWYSPIAQGTGANLEACYFILKYAFNLGFRRIFWISTTKNIRSCKAAQKIGMKFEGIQQNCKIIRDVSIDSVWFRIIDAEWELFKPEFESKLYSYIAN